jgi:hypothetical protein
MPAQIETSPARAGGLKFTCCVCGAQVSIGAAKAEGWRGRRTDRSAVRQPGSGNGQLWWCPAHIPQDLPAEKSPAPSTRVRDIGERRRVTAYASASITKTTLLVFAFSASDIAAAAGVAEWTTRDAIRRGEFDPLSLADIIRWSVERPARGPAVAYDMLATRTPHKLPSREDVLQRFHALGFTAPAAHGIASIDILGDLVTVSSAQRLLQHMEAEGLSTIRRSRARAVMIGRETGPPPTDRADQLADQIRAEIGAGRASGPDAVSVHGVMFDLERGAELLAALRSGDKRRAQITGALALLRKLVGSKRSKAPRASTERKRRKLARAIVRSPDVTAAG